jgi:AcrR family transcriptional regulator
MQPQPVAAAAKTKEELVQEYRIRSIQDAAARVIASKGLNGATMQAIADAAGISKGTIYLYFQNRKELVESTADQAFSQLLAMVREILQGPGTARERLARMVSTEISYLEERRDFFQLYRSIRYPLDPIEESRHDRSRISQHRSHLEQLTRFFEQAMDNGEVRRMDASRLALFFSEGVIAILIRRLSDDEDNVPVDDDVAWMTGALFDGVGGTS